MKITGAAPKIAVPTFIYLLLTIFIDHLTNPFFKISSKPLLLALIGVVLILIGVVIVVIVAVKLQRSFSKGLLMTDGLYKYVRNPMYDAYLVFIIPGICLLFNSWIVLTTILLNFVLLKIFITEEYKFLEAKFGDEYRNYLKRVRIKFL